jgi:signal transduction histidine kinase
MEQRAVPRDGTRAVILTVRDNGVGACAAADPGLGIVGMRERVEALAGRFDLTPAQHGGFGFTASLPIQTAGPG